MRFLATSNLDIPWWVWLTVALIFLVTAVIIFLIFKFTKRKSQTDDTQPSSEQEDKPAKAQPAERKPVEANTEAKPKEKPVTENKEKPEAKPTAKQSADKKDGQTPTEKKTEKKPEPKPAEKKAAEKKPEPKPAAKKEEKPEEKPASTNKVYHIAKRKEDNRWQIKAEGAAKAIKLFNTQAEAIAYAKTLADNQDARIMIHKEDGSFRKLTY